MKRLRILLLCAIAPPALVGCGGGSSATLPPSQVSITITPSSGQTVLLGKTLQFAASVSGSPNTTLSWAVNGTGGGNSTAGTISSSGLYSAPADLPSLSVVTVSATSQADTTKSASASVALTATIETTTQNITAATGGTINLPGGSSVTIPAGSLASDQEITLSLVIKLSHQPPSGLIVGVGDGLVLSTSTPPFKASTGNMGFVISAGTNMIGLQGSAPLADLIDSTGDNFFGVAGSFDTNTNLSSITVPALLMTGTNNVVVSMGNLSPLNATSRVSTANASSATYSFATPNTVPPPPGQRIWNDSAWVPYSGCPAPPLPPGSKVLVLVHGMGSSVEDAYGNNGAPVKALDGTTDFCVNQIRKAAGTSTYGQVVGFDYDWSNDVGLSSGASFANFLNALASCGNPIDIEAHSEGGPVAASGIIQALPHTQGLIGNFVGLGNPWNGTPVASIAVTAQGYEPLLTVLLNLPGISAGSRTTLQTLLAAPFAGQLLPPSSPLSAPQVLDAIQQTLGQKVSHLNMILACGTQPRISDGTKVGSVLSPLFGTLGTNDGIIGLNSCQGLAPSAATGIPENLFAGLTPVRLPPYSLSHVQLACDPQAIHDVGQAVQAPLAVGASLVATPTSLSFSATQGRTNPSSQTLTITSGGAPLAWNATTNAAWLAIAPAGGTTPTAATISANITGLLPGNYNGTITIAASGASNSPLNIPVPLTISSGTDVTGTWTGTWAWSGTGSNGCSNFSDGGSFSMTLVQTGTSFSGSTTAAGIQNRDNATCALIDTQSGAGVASGTISGTTLNLSFDLSDSLGSLDFTGTATLINNTLTATFQRNTGGTGSFTLTRQ